MLWLCSSCLYNKEPFKQKPSCCSEENIISAIKNIFVKKIEEIENNCIKIDKKIDDHIQNTETAFQNTNEASSKMSNDVVELKRTIATNEGIIENLSFAVVNLQRTARLTNLILDGLPDMNETKDLKRTILSISAFLKYNLHPDDIEHCFRVKSGKSKIGQVLIRFASKRTRDGFFAAYLKCGNLKLSNISKDLNIHSRLYFNVR